MKLLRQDSRIAALQMPEESAELLLHDDPDLPAEAVYFLVDDVRQMYRQRQELKLTFSSPPVQVARGYAATVKDPFGAVLHLLDRSAGSSASLEDVGQRATLFSGIEAPVPAKRDLLIGLYQRVGRTADDLPYTPHFEQIYQAYAAAYPAPAPSRAEVWRHLLNLRKTRQLPRLGAARSKPPVLSAASRQHLRELLGNDIGKRDRLPYTPRFDRLVDAFNRSLPRPLSPHLIWRAIATLAK